ncbi:MAG: NfeD family protein [Actinomycetes bacterium]
MEGRTCRTTAGGGPPDEPAKEAARMEWLRESQWLWWLGGGLVLGLVEVVTLDLVFSMLALAALVSSGVALAGGSFTLQVLVFAAVSYLMLAVVRPIAIRKLKPQGPAHRTGTAALVGRQARVVQTVTDRAGLVKLAGEMWSARTQLAGQEFAVDDVVQVVEIDGATAVVDAPGSPPTTDIEGQEAR